MVEPSGNENLLYGDWDLMLIMLQKNIDDIKNNFHSILGLNADVDYDMRNIGVARGVTMMLITMWVLSSVFQDNHVDTVDDYDDD